MAGSDLARVERYRDTLSGKAFRRVVDLLDVPVPAAVRLNPLKVDPSTAIRILSERYGWRVDPVSFCPAGWVLERCQTPPGETLEYRNGHYYIQEASSMLPVEAFDFSAGQTELILDMAAAPGGKSTHLAARAADAGLIVANDISNRRLRSLTNNLRTWGATSAVITNQPGERLGERLSGCFDKVLVDAPCSGEGLRSSAGSKGRRVSDREREALQAQQIGLIHSALQALRVGGELVYATCTAAPEENEAVIQAVLEARSGQVELREIEFFDRPQGAGGLTVFGDHVFHPSMPFAVRLWPFQFNTGAFFTARLRKVGSRSESKTKGFNAVAPTLLARRELDEIHDRMADFGFDLKEVCQRSGLALVDRGRFVHAVSSLWLERLPGLPVKGAGLPVGRWKGEAFVPAHEWVTRFYPQFRERRFILDAALSQRWLRGADLRSWRPPIEAGTILLEDQAGRFLGVGIVSANRVRNLLPRAWVAG